jgi:hypothetical protein
LISAAVTPVIPASLIAVANCANVTPVIKLPLIVNVSPPVVYVTVATKLLTSVNV